jgi:hypothetical protein
MCEGLQPDVNILLIEAYNYVNIIYNVEIYCTKTLGSYYMFMYTFSYRYKVT